jgi:type II secretory pathway pseudopilin PulG
MTTRHHSGGFSSLEVLIGVTLFSVVAAGLAVTTIGSTKANSTSRDVVAAYTLISNKVEEFRASSSDPGLQPGPHNDPNNPLTARGQAGGRFTRSWVVNPDVPKPGMAEVVITVSWVDTSPRLVRAVTYACTTATCS